MSSSRSGLSSSSFGSSRSMASSRSLSARSGSFTIGKGLTSLALDALKFALDGAEINQEGDRFVHLQSEIGERRYTKLCEDVDLALEEIHYCQEGLDILRINARAGDRNGEEIVSPAQVEEMRQMKDLINHDYLVLKIRPGEPKAEVLHIMAHKLRGGIHISHIASSDVTSVFHDGVRCFTVDCRKREPKRIRLEALLAILKEEDPDYSLRNANCWDYAKNTAKRLVKGCVEVRGISSPEKARLQLEHDNLEANLTFRHIQNVATSLLRNASSRASVSNSSRFLIPSRAAELSSLPTSLDTFRISDFTRLLNPLTATELSSLPLARNSPRISNSSGLLNTRAALELSSLPVAQKSSGVSNSSGILNSSRAETLSSLPRAQKSSRVSNSARLVDSLPEAVELSSPPSALNSSKILDPQRSVDLVFTPTDMTASNSPGIVASPRTAGFSSSPSAPTVALASSGKLCLQIVFLLLCLIINNIGLGPWASSLIEGRN